MPHAALANYLDAFAHLRQNRNRTRGAAPHKPILLLAILQECDAGRIAGNRVEITPELVAAFHLLWNALVSPDSGWQPRMAYPFWHLCSDGFWTLDPLPRQMSEPTLKQLADRGVGGRFAGDLWELVKETDLRELLRRHLRHTYFPDQSRTGPEAAQWVDGYLADQRAQLLNQARDPFQRKVREERSDSYFVRHWLFPQVVKEQYGHACCVCHLSVTMGESNLIDAAHILPFADFHNDDPRNGLALCKNHHWGFDAGAWSLTDDGAVLASPRLAPAQGYQGYVETGQPIAPPKDESCRPDPAALRWHRKRWGFGAAAGGEAGISIRPASGA